MHVIFGFDMHVIRPLFWDDTHVNMHVTKGATHMSNAERVRTYQARQRTAKALLNDGYIPAPGVFVYRNHYENRVRIVNREGMILWEGIDVRRLP